MLFLICPQCGEKNSLTAERCQACDASLEDVLPVDESLSSSSGRDEFDLLNETGDDLPDLLHALKHDEEDQIPSQDNQEIPDLPIPEEDSNVDEADDRESEEEIPEWLNRVRQRASQETDSVGEITQKISAALESLAEGKNEDQHESFETWIQSLKESAPEQGSEDVNHSEVSSLNWLAKVRKAQGKLTDENPEGSSSESDQETDSLLQWLVGLEEEAEDSVEHLEAEDLTGEDEIDNTQGTPVSKEDADATPPAISQEDTEPVILEPPKLTVSREEKVQADQLTASIVDERASRPVRKSKKPPVHRVVRLVIGLFLIVGLSLSLFLGQNATLPQGDLYPHNAAVISWAEDLEEDASLLIIFDYQAGYASEISLIAKPILDTAIRANHKVSTLSSTASGVLLSQQLLNDIAVRVGDPINDLGYFPLAAYAAYGAINWRGTNWEIRNYPEPHKALPSNTYDAVLILSDSYEGARVWIEQLSMIVPDAEINLLVTAQAGPLLMPYWESGQVTGMISGLSEAAGIEAAVGNEGDVAVRWRAYQTGLVILIALMTIGVIYGVDQSTDSKKRGGL